MFNKIFPTIAAVAVACAAITQPTMASTTSMLPTNSMEIKLGAFFPGSSGDKFFGGETQLTAGLDYRLSSSGGLTPSASSAYFDYMGGAKNSGYIHAGGIGLDVRSITGPAFFGAGVGIYNTSVRFNDGLSGSKTGAGGKLFAGVQLGRGPSLELDYHVMPQAMGVNPSGLGVELGFHL